jgi:ketosteroid isomerase-like protein
MRMFARTATLHDGKMQDTCAWIVNIANDIHEHLSGVNAQGVRHTGGNAMSRSCCVVTLFAATLTLAAVTVALAQSDPAALLEKHDEAINRGDVAGALALYADDAVIDGGGCEVAPCVGKAAIQKDLERGMANKPHVTILKQYVSGNVVTSRVEFRSDRVKQAGVERVIGWVITAMQGEKIVYTRGGIGDRSDPQTARFAEWVRTQPPAR